MKKIIISPIFKHYMAGRVWMGLDSELIKQTLIDEFDYDVQIINFSNLVSELDSIPQGSTLFYSTIYNINYLNYIKDTINFISLQRPDIMVLPNQDQLRAFENKGFQEYYKTYVGIDRVQGKYYGDIEELIGDNNKMSFPFVLKLIDGALSSGVKLIKNENQLMNFHQEIKKKTFREKAAYFLNKRNSFKNTSKFKPNYELIETNFEEFFEKRKSVVTQAFVPGLDCDYRVLVFGGRFYVFRRETRENDFRASGSGKFQWVIPPTEVLDYAKEVAEKLNTPFVSLDIGIDKNNVCYLFEFQSTGFGPSGVIRSDKYFEFQDDKWNKIETTSILEEVYAYAIDYHIKSKA